MKYLKSGEEYKVGDLTVQCKIDEEAFIKELDGNNKLVAAFHPITAESIQQLAGDLNAKKVFDIYSEEFPKKVVFPQDENEKPHLPCNNLFYVEETKLFIYPGRFRIHPIRGSIQEYESMQYKHARELSELLSRYSIKEVYCLSATPPPVNEKESTYCEDLLENGKKAYVAFYNGKINEIPGTVERVKEQYLSGEEVFFPFFAATKGSKSHSIFGISKRGSDILTASGRALEVFKEISGLDIDIEKVYNSFVEEQNHIEEIILGDKSAYLSEDPGPMHG